MHPPNENKWLSTVIDCYKHCSQFSRQLPNHTDVLRATLKFSQIQALQKGVVQPVSRVDLESMIDQNFRSLGREENYADREIWDDGGGSRPASGMVAGPHCPSMNVVLDITENALPLAQCIHPKMNENSAEKPALPSIGQLSAFSYLLTQVWPAGRALFFNGGFRGSVKSRDF